MFNHNELFMGVFGYDTNNALPALLLDQTALNQVRHTIQKFDQGDYSNNADGQREFLDNLRSAAGLSKDGFRSGWDRRSPSRDKTSAFSLYRTDAVSPRLELRAVRPQANMDMWIHQIELFERRILFLKQIRVPFRIRPLVPLEQPMIATKENHLLNPPVNPQEALKAFFIFVAECGLNWKDHTSYLWPKWISDGEVEKFENSAWFHKQNSHRHRDFDHPKGYLDQLMQPENCHDLLVGT